MKTKYIISGLTLLVGAILCSTATPLLMAPRVMQDGSIQLRWQSEPGAIYAVESTERLPGEAGVSVPFVGRDLRVISQGTETTWLDYGDAGMFERLDHPVDTLHRFYRVEKVDQSMLAPVVVSITQPAAAAVVSGDLVVEVSVSTTNPIGRIRLFVDGQPVGEAYEVDTFQFSVNTTEWINGPHTLHATVELTGESGTTGTAGQTTATATEVGASAPVTVTFDNLIHDFTAVYPFFDPYNPSFPEVQIIYAALAAPCDWTVTVVDENDLFVIGGSGSGSGIYAIWDGTDSFGNPMPPGFYDYIISATIQAGQGAAMASGPTGAIGSVGGLTLLSDPAQVAGRAGQVVEVATSKRRGNSSHLARNLLAIPPPPNRETSRTNGGVIRVPWFMRPNKLETDNNQSAAAAPIPPIPPLVRTRRNAGDWERVLAAYLLQSNNIVTSFLESRAKAAAWRAERLASRTAEGNTQYSQAAASTTGQSFLNSLATQTTRDPRRVPGRTQMSFMGVTSAMSQGNHPSAPWSYGGLVNANAVADGFVKQMAKGSTNTGFPAWRTAFHLKDNQVKRTNIVGRGFVPPSGPIDSSGSWFNRFANIGMLVGHAVELNPPNFPASTWGPLASFPLYDPMTSTNSYVMIPDMEMRFGSQFFRWMGFYGCNVLRQVRWSEAWTRGTWPLNPRLNVYCASASTIYMYPTFGRLWAQALQGELNGTPMTVASAWVEAGRRAHLAEQDSRRRRNLELISQSVIMSYLYWDATQEGGDNTLSDRFKPLQIGNTLTGRTVENLHLDETTVLSP
jgi:hypothetical protein